MVEQASIGTLANVHLGQSNSYQALDAPAPELLVALPRDAIRHEYAITSLSENGYDLWRAYEFTTLTKSGLPLVGALIFTCDMHSAMLVESKSLKLYLHSFLHYKWHTDTQQEIIQDVCRRISNDISQCIGTNTKVSFVLVSDTIASYVETTHYPVLEQQVDATALTMNTTFKAITTELARQTRYRMRSSILVSNCRVTNQPDWGDVFITMEADRTPTASSLLCYLAHFRGHNHFHEECCELIFHHLWQACAPRALGVACMYTRRGGIDINPIRTTGLDMTTELFPRSFLQRTARQ